MADTLQKENYRVSISPHVYAEDDVPRVMRGVVLALLPACAMGVVVFGLSALWVILTCTAACVASEYLCQKIRRRGSTIGDWSAVVTGILLAMNLPSTAPLWMAGLGGVIAIVIAKQVYGGLGNNLFNPALIARIVLLVSFPVQMTARWARPMMPGNPETTEAWLGRVDAVTGATPLAILQDKTNGGVHMIQTMMPDWLLDGLIGFRGGCLGETAVIALLLGAAYLLYRGIITWHIPVSYLGTVFVLTGVAWLCDPSFTMNPIFHLMYGGLILGAFFMATDMVTSPITKTGQILFGCGCGLIVVLIRFFGGYPEGVAFSILLMNATVPLLDKIRPRVLGARRKESA